MTKEELNTQAIHKYFSADCFNAAWDLIDKKDRSELDNQQMLLRSYASLYHWTNRDDCTEQNLSIGFWQLSRVHALLNNPQEAFSAAERCLSYSLNLEPFYLGYAYEALARSKKIAGEAAQFANYMKMAQEQLNLIEDKELLSMLKNDLGSLE